MDGCVKELVYGVFAIRGNGGCPSIEKLIDDKVYRSLDEAVDKAAHDHCIYGSNFEARQIECEVS